MGYSLKLLNKRFKSQLLRIWPGVAETAVAALQPEVMVREIPHSLSFLHLYKYSFPGSGQSKEW
jgi:hypothetical protein